MIKRMALLSLVSALAFAADPPPSDVTAYLDQLQVKLDHAAQRAHQPSAAGGSSVAGLRGAAQTSGPAPLYWKGKDPLTRPTPEEITLFRNAVTQAQTGKKMEAIATLKTFQTKYPKSPLRPDIDETLQRLQ